MHAKFKEYHDRFIDKDKLVQLFHGWDTNAVESFYKLLTEVLTKDRTCTATPLKNKAIIHLALGLQSVGARTFTNAFSNEQG
jgi:hypothetical protein